MLRHAFWGGIRPTIKGVSGYIFDKQLTFDELRSELRSIEQDQKRRKKHNTKERKENDVELVVSVMNDEQSDAGVEEIRGMLKKMFKNSRTNVKVDHKRISTEKISITIAHHINRIHHRPNTYSFIMVPLLWVINLDMGDKYNKLMAHSSFVSDELWNDIYVELLRRVSGYNLNTLTVVESSILNSY